MPRIVIHRTLQVVDADDQYGALPEAYATALRLRAAGASRDDIALRLSVEAEAVPALLRRSADAKFAERPT